MSVQASPWPYLLGLLALFLGSASIALGAGVSLPGLQGFDWTSDVVAGRDVINWLAQLSGGGIDTIPVGILFVLPVFAARFLMVQGRKLTPEQAWEERHGANLLSRSAARLVQAVALVIIVALMLGTPLILYLESFVLPPGAVDDSFLRDSLLAIVVASVLYFLLALVIEALTSADGAMVITFCGAAATFGRAVTSATGMTFLPIGDMAPEAARAMSLSALALPAVIFVLMARRPFVVMRSRSLARSKKSIPVGTGETELPFPLIPTNTLRVAVGLLLWVVTAVAVAMAIANHTSIDIPHAFDWFVFPLQPIVIALTLYVLATGRLNEEMAAFADRLRREGTYLPDCLPGAETTARLVVEFRWMLSRAALTAGAISAVVTAAYWASGASALESFQGLAWLWTLGVSGYALMLPLQARVAGASILSRPLPRLRWSPARAHFTILCVAAAIDRTVAHEERFESLALARRTRALHEVDRQSLYRWLSEVEAKQGDRRELIDLATRAIEDYPADPNMRRAIYTQCADIAHADRKLKGMETWFLKYLATGLGLARSDRARIDGVVGAKNLH